MKSELKYSARLMPINAVSDAVYNPRLADEKRLAILEISIRKLGFILPLYAHDSGELLSGHQRTLVAKRIGYEHIPVVEVEEMTKEKRKATNIAFNRATNDFNNNVKYENLLTYLGGVDFDMLCNKINDKKGDDQYRCINPIFVDMQVLLEQNNSKITDYALSSARLISQYEMPIVCTKDNNIVNGIGRMAAAAERGKKELPVVYIDNEEAELATIVLNFLTMDFDIHNKYRNELQYNSFRRKRGRVKGLLSRSFTFFHFKGKGRFDIAKPGNPDLWKSIYGNSVVDVGAGTLADCEILRSVGVECLPLEPYRLKEEAEEIDYEASVKIMDEFLDQMQECKEYDSIFMNAIMNSVPFHADREKIVKLLSIICTKKTVVYTLSSSARSIRLTSVRDSKESFSNDLKNNAGFTLEYEDNVVLRELHRKPKMQKYFTLKEWRELWEIGFSDVHVIGDKIRVYAVCRNPKQLTFEEIKEIADYEFDMPYPNGKTMGLSKKARNILKIRAKAFGKVEK